MPLAYTIIPPLGMVYVRYSGVATVAETAAVFARYGRDPHCRPGQKQLIDLAGVIDYERDFAKIAALQATKADTLLREGHRSLAVYHAPTGVSFSMARLIARSWEGLDGIVPVITREESQAMELLGLRERRFADLPLKEA